MPIIAVVLATSKDGSWPTEDAVSQRLQTPFWCSIAGVEREGKGSNELSGKTRMSRMMGDYHVRLCESLGVKFIPWATRINCLKLIMGLYKKESQGYISAMTVPNIFYFQDALLAGKFVFQ